MIQFILKLFNVVVEQSKQNRAQQWRPPQLAIWMRAKKVLMDVPDQASLILALSTGFPLSYQSYFLLITVVLAVQRGCDGCTGPHYTELGLIS